jgi:hypothetical protein
VKKSLLIIIWSILTQLNAGAQSKNGIENYNFLSSKEAYVWMPVVHHQSKKGFYTEMRYNYEDVKTASLYLGKNFNKNAVLNYSVTPMLGIVFGKYNGGSLAMNIDVENEKAFICMQTQYTISSDEIESNFFFNWTELAYQPLNWFYAGVSMQQTKVYNTSFQSEYGVLVGFSIKKFTMPVYIFNPLNKSRNFIVGINVEW